MTPPPPSRHADDPSAADPTPAGWSPSSWTERTARQMPTYREPAALTDVAGQLAELPPLVTSWEIEKLREEIAAAAAGDAFLLQGGDCAERFDECTSDQIAGKLKILLQMSLVLVYGSKKRVVRVGRFAGQYAKPRSTDTETRGDVTLPSYRGDNVNAIGFTPEEREPDPQRLLRGYERAALTLNFIRALVDGGFADLHHPEYWDLGFVEHSPERAAYERIVDRIGDSIRFMEAVSGRRIQDTGRVDFYTSHEALHLHYEQALTRRVPRRHGWWNLSTHMPWIGMRTAVIDEAHIEYCRGIRNPIGIKVGPGTEPEGLIRLLETLDPAGTPGRLTLISRFGAHGIAAGLPPLVEAVRRAGRPVLWIADPMHGNTESTPAGIKTRKFEHILAELEQAFEIHEAAGSRLGGVHFELTGENVTECTGGARGLVDEDLGRDYRTQVDPRLNDEQALEMALRIARRIGKLPEA
ncbi:MAG: class II 3-deoxy-7-phosphoheptulonate synthase [Phycisphaerales bacterium]